MPDRTSVVLSRRNRLKERQGSRRRWRLMGGVGLGILVSILVAILILLGALAYADLTRDLPNVALLPALLNPPDGLLLQPTRVYDRTGQHLLFTFSSESPSAAAPAAAGEDATSAPGLRRYIPLSTA